ncbi:DoxX family protein [bacterium]|nr:DoxX family protein [bacterium]
MVKTWEGIFNTRTQQALNDVGLLLLRVFFAGMMFGGHGLGKLLNFNDKMDSFSDPLGIGSAASLALAVGAEFFCSILVFFGIATRFAAIPLMITMFVAGFLVHLANGDPFFSKVEFPMLYLMGFAALALMGPGRLSVDHLIKKRMLRA